MTTTSVSDQRCEPRYQVAQDRAVEVFVQRHANGLGATIPGRLTNLSLGGVQLSLPTYLKFSEEIQLRVEIAEANVTVSATATVCWIRPAENNQCLHGCSFAINLSEAVLDRLAAAGIIDRRRHPRQAINVPGKARRELDAESYPVQITDYSDGGFCMRSGNPITVGGSVSVVLDASPDTTSSISGKVCWQEERDGEYFVGCSVKHVEHIELLRRLWHELDGEDRTTSVSPGSIDQTLFLVATWVFVFIGSTVLGLAAIRSWHSRPPTMWLEASPIISVSNLRAESQTADGNRWLSDLGTVDMAEKHLEHDADSWAIGQYGAQDTTVQKADPVSIGDLVHTEIVCDIPTRVVTSSTRATIDQDSPSLTLFDEFVVEDRIPRHTPTPIDTQRATPVNTGSRATNELIQRINVFGKPLVDPRKANSNATKALVAGERFYRASEYAEAKVAFQTAVQNDSGNALYYYLLAITEYQLGQFDEAETIVQKAIWLEKDAPIKNWGSRLSRYQGQPRLWVEQQRLVLEDPPDAHHR